jgi:hypothetical protein
MICLRKGIAVRNGTLTQLCPVNKDWTSLTTNLTYMDG